MTLRITPASSLLNNMNYLILPEVTIRTATGSISMTNPSALTSRNANEGPAAALDGDTVTQYHSAAGTGNYWQAEFPEVDNLTIEITGRHTNSATIMVNVEILDIDDNVIFTKEDVRIGYAHNEGYTGPTPITATLNWPYRNIFLTKAELNTAVAEWIANESDSDNARGNISEWNVSAITDMSSLFQSANVSDRTIDLSNWDMSNVTKADDMFRDWADLGSGSFTANNWNLSNCTDVNSMFYLSFSGSSTVTPSLQNWTIGNSSNGAIIYSMFADCSKFNGDISGWDVYADGTDNTKVFENCNEFQGTGLSSSTFTLEGNCLNFFKNCTALGNSLAIDLSSWNMTEVDHANSFFSRTTNLGQAGFTANNWNLAKCKNVNSMFYLSFSGSSTVTPSLQNWTIGNSSNGTVIYSMFTDCSKFDGDISNWTVLAGGTNNSRVFENCNEFQGTGLSSSTFTLEGNCYNFFKNCTALGNSLAIDLSSWNMTEVTHANEFFISTTNLGQAGFTANNWNLAKCNSVQSMFSNSFSGSSIVTPSLQNWTIGDSGTECLINSMFNDCSKFNGNISNWDVYGATSGNIGVFLNCISFQGNGLSSSTFTLLGNCHSFFENCTVLGNTVDIDLSSWNMTNVIYSHEFFQNASSLGMSNFTINNWDLSNCINVKQMFLNSFTNTQNGTVTLTGWTIGKSTASASTQSMFNGCTKFNGNLANWTVYSNDGQSMFRTCSAYVGTGLDTHDWYITSGTSSNLIFFSNFFTTASNLNQSTVNTFFGNILTIGNANAAYNHYIYFGLWSPLVNLPSLTNATTLQNNDNWTFVV